MQIKRLSNSIDITNYLNELGVDKGGISILASKTKQYIIYISDMHVGAANILKQDALSVGADLAVPRGTVTGSVQRVDAILIGTKRQLEVLSKKELAQPFGLKGLGEELKRMLHAKKPKTLEIMGVLNANEDSFFSGSRFDSSVASKRIEQMIEQGADIIDIGAVSSRPGAPKVSVEEELSRITPILEVIKQEKLYQHAKFSVDSYEPVVVKTALESGFSIVNDITGLANDEVVKLCVDYKAQAVAMHMQGTPQDMQDNPSYDDVVLDIYNYFEQRLEHFDSLGLKDVVLDVGIGFGKTLEHNLALIAHLEHFLTLGKPLLVGASRKSMIDKIFASKTEDRLAGTLAIHMEAYRNGASVVRVHDVYEHAQARKVLEAIHSV